jgi:hypothetical protein
MTARDWWRRNRIALGALVVVAPLTVGVVAGLPILDDLIYSPQATETIPFGETVEIGGVALTVTASIDADDEYVPGDLHLIGVLVEMVALEDGDRSEFYCGVTLTDAGPGGSGERTWKQPLDGESVGWYYIDDSLRTCNLQGYDPTEDDGDFGIGPAPVGCTSTFELVFLTPPRVYDEATLELTVSSDDVDPVILRFALDYDYEPEEFDPDAPVDDSGSDDDDDDSVACTELDDSDVDE